MCAVVIDYDFAATLDLADFKIQNKRNDGALYDIMFLYGHFKVNYNETFVHIFRQIFYNKVNFIWSHFRPFALVRLSYI